VIGIATGAFAGRWLRGIPDYFAATVGAGQRDLGGRLDRKADRDLERTEGGEADARRQIVIQDIGEQSARFLELLGNGATSEGREVFFAGMFDSNDLEVKRTAIIAANCQIVFHEHLRLEPYIQGAMPFIIRGWVTQRWMT
jgi:hypothetical protein